MRAPSRPRDEEGSVSVELAVLAPIVGLLLLCVVAVGRVQNARADVEGAARAAARDLSISRDPDEAVGRVRDATSIMLGVGSPGCRTFNFVPTVVAGQVTVSVSCVADLREASVLPLPGSMTLSATASEAIDRHREGNE